MINLKQHKKKIVLIIKISEEKLHLVLCIFASGLSLLYIVTTYENQKYMLKYFFTCLSLNIFSFSLFLVHFTCTCESHCS